MRRALTLVALAATATLWSAACRSRADQAAAADVKAAITAAIQSQGDSLTVTDPASGQPITLTFDHVHEGVAATLGGRHVACVDFRGAEGATYDVDYYVGRASGAFRVEDVVLHKAGDRGVIADSTRTRLESKPGS